ncbi:MAG: hypothetical protein GXP29_00645, partial [Planctomycetes bacterium]|nr:hypothetical protein [Planctomycetota bacterium]
FLKKDPQKVTEGDFLLYAIACGWFSSMAYVHHPLLSPDAPDIPHTIMKDFTDSTEKIRLGSYPSEAFAVGSRVENFEPLAVDPEVPLELVSGNDFKTADAFDFVYLTRSPRYTPESADDLIPIIREYIQVES